MVTENDRWRRACNRDENEWMRNARETISLAWWTPFIPRVGRVSHVEAGGCNSRVPLDDCNHFPSEIYACVNSLSEGRANRYGNRYGTARGAPSRASMAVPSTTKP
jgi:hypothetical protein